jgi:isochorismate hydrolase
MRGTILVADAVAEVSGERHAAELKIMRRIFADVKTTDEVVTVLGEATAAADRTAQFGAISAMPGK